MKSPDARNCFRLAFLCIVLLPSLLRAQGPGQAPHQGPPPGSMPGAPGNNSPASGASNQPGARLRDASPAPRGAISARSSSQFGPAGRWWDDKNVIKSIGITQDQQKRMDGIFDVNKPAILQSYKTFLKEQTHLESVNKDPHADQATTFAAIDAVNNARAALQKATAQMLLQIRHEMRDEQIDKLEKLP